MPHEVGIKLQSEDADWWSVHRGDASIIGTAIHNGHETGHAVAPLDIIQPCFRNTPRGNDAALAARLDIIE